VGPLTSEKPAALTPSISRMKLKALYGSSRSVMIESPVKRADGTL
jgi:hypothetical protein